MSKVKNGDTVKIHFTGKLKGGELFDTSRKRQPLEFIVGNGEMMPGLEKSIIGMEAGDTKSIEVPPEEAFGTRREELVVKIMKNNLPYHIEPYLGQRLKMRDKNGNGIDLSIIEIKEETITLDANHPLVGQTLCFDLELVEIG